MAKRRKSENRWGMFALGLGVALFVIGAAIAAPRLDAPSVERLVNATVKIEAAGRLCSGVAILSDGLILTNAHCAAADDKVVDVETRDGRKFKGLILVRDEAADVMVIAVRARGLARVPLDCGVAIAQGDEVTAVGHPGGILWSVTRGIVVGLDRGEDKRWIQIDALIWFGNSGGPLFDRFGRLVGLNNAVRGEPLPWGGGQITYGYTLNLRHICATLKRKGVAI